MASTRRKCVNHPDVFCFICGEYTLIQHRRSVTDFVKKAYLAYFKVKLGDQDKPWAPHVVCKVCTEHLRQWTYGKRRCMKFGIPMVWHEQRNHCDDCYFCSVNVKGINGNNRSKWTYPDLDSARRPVPHSGDIPIPEFSCLPELSEEEQETAEIESCTDQNDDDFQGSSPAPSRFSQHELNDLVRDLNLPKKSSELLASRLAEKNLLLPETRISAYRN